MLWCRGHTYSGGVELVASLVVDIRWEALVGLATLHSTATQRIPSQIKITIYQQKIVVTKLIEISVS